VKPSVTNSIMSEADLPQSRLERLIQITPMRLRLRRCLASRRRRRCGISELGSAPSGKPDFTSLKGKENQWGRCDSPA
jgi:hypothetical protein